MLIFFNRRIIPGGTPWVLVTTKLGREFIHNPQTKVSLWKAPEDVRVAINAMPPENETAKEPRVKKIKIVAMPGKGDIKEVAEPELRGTKRPASAVMGAKNNGGRGAKVEDEGEENEEDEESGNSDEDEEGEEGHESKRLKTGGPAPPRPVEFTEEDIAWQLEAMAEEYGLDEEDLDESGEMTEEENIGLFKVNNPETFWV